MLNPATAADQLVVGGLTPMTTVDYPDRLSAVVFCQGCPLRCRYCHNPELMPRRSDEQIAWPEVLSFLQQRRGLLDAVVFSGGEPTLQRALPQAISEVRALGYEVGLHTAGIYPERLKQLLPLLDWVGLDIKALPEDYPHLTGMRASGHLAWRSAEILVASGISHELRTTHHPALMDPADRAILKSRVDALQPHRHRWQTCQTGGCFDSALNHSFPSSSENVQAVAELLN